MVKDLIVINNNLHIRRWRNQPVQREAKKLFTPDETFYLKSAIFSKFHALDHGSQLIIQSLTAKLGNILAEKELKELGEEFANDINLY